MSLYNKASLIQVPSLYKDGTLVSTIPEDRSGDFTFSRGSDISATRVNADGYIEKGYENLLLQSDWDDVGTGIAPTGWSSFSPSINYEAGAEIGQIRFSTSSSRGYIQQSQPYTSGVFTLSVYCDSVTTSESLNSIFYPIGSTIINYQENGVVVPANTQLSAGNRYSVTFSLTGFSFTTRLGSGCFTNVTADFTLSRPMLNQGLVAYPYIETTTAPVAGGILEDMPRLDYSNGSCPALLLEPQRTNLITQSESSVGWNYQSPISVTSNSSISPEGVSNATKITKVANGNMFYRIYTTPVVGCFSVFAKKGNWRYIGLRNNQSAGNDHSVFDFDTQTFVKEASGQTCTFEDYGNGWYRLNAYQPNNESNGLYGIALTDENGAENSGVSVVPNDSYIYVYGFQAEQDATYPTSYIPTYGVSQTRLRDSTFASVTNTTSRTYFLDGKRLAEKDISNTSPVYDPNDNLKITFWSNNRLRFRFGGGVNQYYTLTGDDFKIALSYNGTDSKIFVNGQYWITQTSFDLGNVSVLTINGNESISYNQLLLFPTALSDDECIALTTIS
jgi:hypothetical protein